MSEVVLDASALLALVNQEPGQDMVAEFLPRSLVSAVNASELVAKLTDQGVPEDEVQGVLVALDLTIISLKKGQVPLRFKLKSLLSDPIIKKLLRNQQHVSRHHMGYKQNNRNFDFTVRYHHLVKSAGETTAGYALSLALDKSSFGSTSTSSFSKYW